MVFRWRRPLLLTYNDNYRYGTSLYSSTAGDVEKKYRETMSRTYMRSDRQDLGMSTFSGSQLHGGLPAANVDTGTATTTTQGSKKSYADLYAPMSFGYGRSYYNNLRASSEPRTTTKKSADTKKSSAYYSSSEEKSTKDITSSSSTSVNKITKSSSDYDNLNKTVTTTTTTERWVPLSHYLYPSSTSYYYYTEPQAQTTSDLYFADDVKIKKSTTKRDIVDALDLSVSSAYTSDKVDNAKFDYGFWTEKCREIQGHLDHVNRWVGDAESKIKTDLVGARNKMQTELGEVAMLVDDTTKYNEELQRIIKRQARQISDLHCQHDEINRHLSEVNENLEKSRIRCQGLQAELGNVQSVLEMAAKRRQ